MKDVTADEVKAAVLAAGIERIDHSKQLLSYHFPGGRQAVKRKR